MNLDVDYLIKFYKNNTKSVDKEEFTEQDAAASSPTSGGGGKSMPKWEDVVGGPVRGKANPLGKSGEKWESGVKRGVANQVW